MIKCHPNIDESSFKSNIDTYIKLAELEGYVSKDLLKQLFNLFSWLYMEDDFTKSFDNSRLALFLSRFDLYRFKGGSICYSAVLFYQKLSKVIDIRELERDNILEVKTGGNKLFSEESFKYKEMYDIYKESKADLSTDFLLFNELFKNKSIDSVKKMTSIGDITRVLGISNIVRPDLMYNILSNKLSIKYEHDLLEKENKKMYVLQDCTFSMQMYDNMLKILKAFIINEAFTHDYEIEWLFISDVIHKRKLYKKENIGDFYVELFYGGIDVNTALILSGEEFINKKVVLITDGTDSLNYNFNTKTKDINVISFLENEKIKNKISNYGRFFKVFP